MAREVQLWGAMLEGYLCGGEALCILESLLCRGGPVNLNRTSRVGQAELDKLNGTGTTGEGMGHAKKSRIWTVFMLHRHAPETCSKKEHLHAAWTCSIDVDLGRTTRKCSMNMLCGHTAGTFSIDMRYGHATWTCKKDMKQGH